MCNAQIELEVLYRLPLPWRPPSTVDPQPPDMGAQLQVLLLPGPACGIVSCDASEGCIVNATTKLRE